MGKRLDRAGSPAGRGRLSDPWLIALIPAIFALVLTFVLPLAYLAANSLHHSTGPGQVGAEFTLDNYYKFFGDRFYLQILLETFWLGAIVVSICAVLAYPVAYLIARISGRWRGILIFLVVAPLLISVVVRNLGFYPVLGDSGMINWLLLALGLITESLRLNNNFTGVVIGMVHALLPFMIIMLTTVIQKIDPELEEAAIGLGAGTVQTFWYVLWPLSRAGLLAGYLVVFTLAVSAYTTPAMMGGHRVLVMSTFVEQQMRSVLDYAFGATAAVVLVAGASALMLLSLRHAQSPEDSR